MKMGPALITLSILFAIGGFVCLYEEQNQSEEIAYLRGVVDKQAAEIKQDEQIIGEMGQ